MNLRGGSCILLAGWWAASAAAPAAALDPSLAITQYVQNVWRAPQHLPHDNVTSLLQGRDGYLWIGTVEGLARFDGVRSIVYDKSNTPAFSDNWIKALFEDRLGRLWIGTYGGGLLCRENGRFVRYGAKEGLPSDVILAVTEDRHGRVWVGTGGAGLFRFDSGRFERDSFDAAGGGPPPGKIVRAILEDSDGVLWIGTETGLFHRGRDGWERQSGLSDDIILALAADREGLWIGTEKGGLNRLAGGRVAAITPSRGLAHERVWSLAVDQDGNLWIGTDGGGLQRLRDGRLATLSTRNGLTNDYVWAIREDREGSLWVGTNGGGLLRLRTGRVKVWGVREGLPSDFIWAVARGRDGCLYVGTEDAGLLRLRGERIESFALSAAAAGAVKVLLERRDGGFWLGGHDGLALFRDGRVRPAGAPELAHQTIHALVEDDEGTLWIGSSVAGLYALRGGELRRVPLPPELQSESISTLLVARDGALWVGTLGGLARLVEGTWSAWTRAQGLPSSNVTDLFEGPGGAIWVATRGGLARWRDGALAAVTAADGLLDDGIMTALLAADGTIWLGGNRGLSSVKLAEVEAVLEGRRRHLACSGIGLEDGLRSVEINGSGASSFEDADGRLWFTTRAGLISVEPHSRLARRPPPVAIEEVLADGRVLPAGGSWRLSPGVRRLVFHFTALSLASVPGTRLRHRLEPFDGDWVDSPPDRTAEYTNLPHGRYRFVVTAATRDGAWNEAGAAVELEIAPRLVETLWFRAALVALFLLAGPSFYNLRVWRLRRRQAALEQMVTARTAEVEAANVKLAHLAREDALTGLANRRAFDEALDEEWRRGARLSMSLSLLLIDVDAFKAYNDSAGHLAGDACLKSVAEALRSTFQRAGELAARFGGEEFAVLLPAVSRETALAAAESVRQRVFDLALSHGSSPVAAVVTVSVGVAWAQPSGDDSSIALVAAADEALYRAKKGGRNRVELGAELSA